MTREKVKEYLTTEITLASLSASQVSQRVDRAIDIGLDELWGAWAWRFKQRNTTLVITEVGQDSYELPEDFGGMKGIRENETTAGEKLAFREKDEFDRLFPKQSHFQDGIPIEYTVFQEGNEWRIALVPRPDPVMNLPYSYFLENPGDTDSVPSKGTPALLACCVKWLYALGSEARQRADIACTVQIEALKKIDRVHFGKIHHLFQVEERPVRRLPWVDSF